MAATHIVIRGCRHNNLQNLDLDLPRDRLICLTGVSGSGKSSLAFDTLFAEGERRYLESLAVHGGFLPRPAVDLIEGLPPTLAIGRGVSQLGHRQTVATLTEIQDLLAVLYARIGQQHSPTTGELLYRHTAKEITEILVTDYPPKSRLELLAPLALVAREEFVALVERLQRMGYTRLRLDGREYPIEEVSAAHFPHHSIEVVVDRLAMQAEIRARLLDSVILALRLGNGRLMVRDGASNDLRHFSEYYYCASTGERFDPAQPHDFNFRSPRGWCPVCEGEGCRTCDYSGLKPQARACKIRSRTLPELLSLPSSELAPLLESWTLLGNEAIIAAEVAPRVHHRLELLAQLGLGYIELCRRADTLSIGEAQRVQLAAQIGARLAGIAYVMDEPSRGLHPADMGKLTSLLLHLRQLGNTLVVVEHASQVILIADHILELGPGAGRMGGQVTYQGDIKGLLASDTATGKWLSGKISSPQSHNRVRQGELQAAGITRHNLSHFAVTLPLGVLVAVCGVSGCGKSTLFIDVLAKELASKTPSIRLSGDLDRIAALRVVDQRAAGISTRSIPASYVGILAPLRRLLAETPLARARGYGPEQFSLNRKGGRCDRCEGVGVVRVRLTPLPDVWARCEVCQGRRFNFETLQVAWQGHSIADILEMTAAEAHELFKPIPPLADRLLLLVELGLDYLQLGQPFHTLSGGEAQRLKLVTDLARPPNEPCLYILDEPSAGLHAADVAKLMAILHRLVEDGHSVWIIEHRLEILRQADWLIELGPGAGAEGGKLIFEGRLDQLQRANTPTGSALRQPI
jgi:excinuclease ABC subunit A